MNDWLLCKREGQYFVTVRSCVDINYGGGTKGPSDRRRCVNRNTCSEVFGCANRRPAHGTAHITEARHGYVRLLWCMEGAICYVRCGAPVCCGAKKVSLGPSGYLGFFTCKRRQLARMACILFSTMLHELRGWRRSAHGALPCHSDVRSRWVRNVCQLW